MKVISHFPLALNWPCLMKANVMRSGGGFFGGLFGGGGKKEDDITNRSEREQAGHYAKESVEDAKRAAQHTGRYLSEG